MLGGVFECGHEQSSVCWVGCLIVGVNCLKCTDGIMGTEFEGLWC